MEQTEIKQEVAKIENREISDKLLNNFNQLVVEGQLKFPDGYNVGNQLKLAYLSLKESGVAAKCSATSVANTLTEMVLQGLDISKKQCYFIPYGNTLQMFRSYFGDIAVAYSTGLVKDIKATIIYQGDEIETDIVDNERVIKSHHTSFGNQDNPIIGAYAIATLPDGTKRYCIMTKKEIDMSWSKAKTKNVQQDFPTEMAKRTVIRRLVKMLFNTATSSDVFQSSVIASFNRTTEKEYNNEPVEKDSNSKSNINIPNADNFIDGVIEEETEEPKEE